MEFPIFATENEFNQKFARLYNALLVRGYTPGDTNHQNYIIDLMYLISAYYPDDLQAQRDVENLFDLIYYYKCLEHANNKSAPS